MEHYIISFIIPSEDTGEQAKVYYAGASEGVDVTGKSNFALKLNAQTAEEIVLLLRQSKLPGMTEVKIELAPSIDDNSDPETDRGFIKENIDAERYNVALAHSDALINMTSELFFDDWFERGYCHFMLGQHEGAISSYQKADAVEPNNHQTLSNIAISLLQIGRSSEGFDYFQKALSINPNIAPAWLHIGYYYITLSAESDLAHVKAVNAFRRAIQIAPQFAEDKVLRPGSDDTVTIKSITDASIDLESLSDEEILFLSWFDRAAGYGKTNELDKSLDCYEKHLEGSPQDYRALNNMGVIQLTKGSLSDAKNLFMKAIDIKEDYDVGWYNLAKAYREEGDYNLSIERCKRVLEINPEYDDVWTTLGNNYMALRMPRQALESYNQAVKLNPNDYRAYYNKGRLEVNLGLHVEAVKSMEKFIEIVPDALIDLQKEALLILSKIS